MTQVNDVTHGPLTNAYVMNLNIAIDKHMYC
jgi:hypothetical protein